MTDDIRAVFWKEWREFGVFSGGRRELGLILFIAVIGIYVPFEMGIQWVESPLLLMIWAWLPTLLAGPLAADSFAGERERHTLETLLSSRLPDHAILFGKLAALATYALAITWIVMLVGIVTVNVAHGHGALILYSPLNFAGSIGVSILGAVMASGFGTLVSLRSATARQAQQLLGRLPIVLVLLAAIGARVIPHAWQTRVSADIAAAGVAPLIATGLCVIGALAAIVVRLAVLKFRRAGALLD
jgi:ABC-2 type transport system permease protein